MERSFAKVLVANRGEIARRVLRALREMGIASAAVYSDADAEALHVREADEAVRIGPAPSAESYLRAERIVEAARAVGADAVHPGYGFLSEDADFAAACEAAGLVFVGPPAEAIRQMGRKAEAKARMQAAGVPVIAGFTAEGLAELELADRAAELGYPLLVKASAGGGGRGMRVVREAGELAPAMASARREALSAFGDGALLVERYLEAPRHVEIQILGDSYGALVHVFERECSVQRRHQKLIEEAPSPALDERLRGRMGAAALAAAKAIGYVGAGTVEFVLDGRGDFYFLEVNTRLQVEHPVTEAVTGLDLVQLQIRIAQGEPLPFAQDDLRLRGHAIEARLYAEDPARDFLPAAGRLALFEPPALPGLRCDAAVEAGSVVTAHYDPLLAKLVASGSTREEARRRLVAGLRRLAVAGLATNREFLVAVLEHPEFAAGRTDTHFVERHLPPERRAPAADATLLRLHALVAALFGHEARRAAGGPLPPGIPSGWRNNPVLPQEVAFASGEARVHVRYRARGGGRFEVRVEGGPGALSETSHEARVVASTPHALDLEVDGVRRRFRVAAQDGRLFVHGPTGSADLALVPRFPPSAREAVAGGCVAPMTGVVREVRVAPGDRVAAGDVLVVLEAMKMEHALRAAAAGVVAAVQVEVGQMVDPDAVLVVVEPEEDGDGD